VSASAGRSTPDLSPQPSAGNTAERKPRLALFIATVCGLGYLSKAPGTLGSVVGVGMYVLIGRYLPPDVVPWHMPPSFGVQAWWAAMTGLPISIVIAAAGVWASGRVARFSRNDDPQFVVIDEVSGQHLTYLLALAPLNWKYLVLGFILFRAFDIWKPFPARKAEALPGGWGIMADDWVAGVYAAIGLWIARAAGL
jgi:phosphatidylglycerophosphatase A